MSVFVAVAAVEDVVEVVVVILWLGAMGLVFCRLPSLCLFCRSVGMRMATEVFFVPASFDGCLSGGVGWCGRCGGLGLLLFFGAGLQFYGIMEPDGC